MLWTFISIDVVTTTMQVTGAGMIDGATSKQKDPITANNVSLAGLTIQTTAFAIFLGLLRVVIFAICGNKHLIENMRRQKILFLAVLPIAGVLVFVWAIFGWCR